MKTIKVFLASSAEFDADKEQLELFVSRKNKDYNQKRLFLELSTWKEFIVQLQKNYSGTITEKPLIFTFFKKDANEISEISDFRNYFDLDELEKTSITHTDIAEYEDN